MRNEAAVRQTEITSVRHRQETCGNRRVESNESGIRRDVSRHAGHNDKRRESLRKTRFRADGAVLSQSAAKRDLYEKDIEKRRLRRLFLR